MSFLRSKDVNGRVYFQLVENKYVKGKTIQKVIKHLGTEDAAREYCRLHHIPFTSAVKLVSKDTFFDSGRQLAEYVTAIRGRREIPLKFEYMKDGAQGWRRLIDSPSYGLGSLEYGLIDKNLEKILEETGKANIIDLGCGTGEKALSFLLGMSKMSKPKYVAFDISQEMLDLAKKTIGQKLRDLNADFVLVDFEQTNLAKEMEEIREKNFRKSLFLFLGNTVGNVADKGRVLSNIRDSMNLDDYMLMGIELFNVERIAQILDRYRKSPEVKNLVFNVISHYGVQERDGNLVVTFNREKSQVEGHFIINKDLRLRIGQRRVMLNKGDSILLMMSFKGSPRQLQVLLADSGFVILQLYMSPNEEYALILCKPAKF